MQSSYNVIKNDYVKALGNKEIVTNIDNIRYKEKNVDEQEESNTLDISEQQELARQILEEANREKERILSETSEAARRIEKEAYDNAYAEGSQRGYTDAYEKTLIEARAEAEEITSKANSLLLSAKAVFEDYLEDKRDEVVHLAVTMAETVLKRELSSKEGLNEIIREVLNNSRNAASFIIRTNTLHCEEIKAHIEDWKSNLVLRGEIFVVADDNLGPYDAVVEKNNGRIEIGLKHGIEGIKEALF